tara:strand:- start:1043 stop:1459 length:417 start_codon:yes stop_codon:yes gene_type:complete
MEIKQVSVECVDVFWDKVKGWLKGLLEDTDGRHTLETTYNLLKQGTMTMFLITHDKKITAVVVTQKVYYPAKEVLCFLFVGGTKVCRYLKQIEDFMKEYARSLGLDTVECFGRKGWMKVMKKQKMTMKLSGYTYEFFT